MTPKSTWPYLLLALCLSGCLPYSCAPTESRALLSADSLSRAIADALPVDTLRLAWTSGGPEEGPLEHPRTVLFDGAGRVVVSDAARSSLFVFDTTGAFVEEITNEGFAFPYLAGLRGDTLLVFNPTDNRIDFVAEGAVVHAVHTPPEMEPSALKYVAADSVALYLKVVEKEAGWVLRMDRAGGVVARQPLDGPNWRHAGLLRVWGDTLLSLSGYRPLLDRLPTDLTAPPDSLRLTGFDSPMLARSRQFLLGDTHQPPLLTAAAVPIDDVLFLLNMRPGWLRLDVYDRAGHLRHVLTQEDPSFNKDYFPADLAVRRMPSGAYAVAVVAARPAPHVSLYRWTPPVP